MSGLDAFRLLLTLLCAAGLAFALWMRGDDDGADAENSSRGRYSTVIPPLMLPGCMAALALLGALTVPEVLPDLLIQFGFPIFLQIAVYDLLLLALLPLLRRRICARTCALLWLLPNELYLTFYAFMRPQRPLAVLRWDGSLRGLLLVWAVGFAGVLLWKTVGHLRFRRRLLRGAYPPKEEDVHAVWDAACAQAGVRKPPKLMIAPAARTPMTVGLLRPAVRVVLPERAYSAEELTLIFRHELVHLGRSDCKTKFFLCFCTALCWFNPLMWMAMRRSADDLELSCDEAVLAQADESERRAYAELLLRTAGDERGFTSCLSASASALRYRLEHVLRPQRRWRGAIAAGVLLFLLTASCGWVALAYGGGTVGEAVFDNAAFSEKSFAMLDLKTENGWSVRTCSEPQALWDALCALPAAHLTGGYEFSEEPHGLMFSYCTDDAWYWVTLTDHTIRRTQRNGHGPRETLYLPEGIDWDGLSALLKEVVYYAAPEGYPPELWLETDAGTFCAGRQVDDVVCTGGGQAEFCFDGHGCPDIGGSADGCVRLRFSEQPEECTVRIETPDGVLLREENLPSDGVLRMEEEQALYTVTARFVSGRGTEAEMLWTMKFIFASDGAHASR